MQKFELGQLIRIGAVNLGVDPKNMSQGTIIGRAEYLEGDDAYFVRYTDRASGVPKREWFAEAELTGEVPVEMTAT